MIDGIRFKVCGLTSLVDAEFADRCGADCLGFIFHPKSPRHLTREQFRAMGPRLPPRRKVAVSVEPSLEELTALRDAGFDYFQIHHRLDVPEKTLTAWSRLVGRQRLWLAPKLPPGSTVPPAVLHPVRYVSGRRIRRVGSDRRLAGVRSSSGGASRKRLDSRRRPEPRKRRCRPEVEWGAFRRREQRGRGRARSEG
jgi:hypothetical protein